jgi:AcrR family transcriptional regulator
MDEAPKNTKPETPRSRKVLNDRPQKEERMLAAAQHLFAERGFHAVSVRDIAAEAGVSHALVHRYLGSKEDILTAAMKRNTGPVLGVAQAAGSVREAAPAMFRELLAHRRDYLKLLARMGMDRVPFDTLKPEFPAYALLIELLEADAVQRGRRLPDPRVLAASLTALAIGWTVTEDWLVRASRLDDVDPQVIEASVGFILESMIDGGPSPAAVDDVSDEPSRDT